MSREVRIPERDERERDQPAAAVAAPLLDHPVVVGADARERELLVVGLVERLATEPRERRKRQRAVDPVDFEVLLALLGVEAPRGLLLPPFMERLLAFARHDHFVTEASERLFEQNTQLIVVVHDEDPPFFH